MFRMLCTLTSFLHSLDAITDTLLIPFAPFCVKEEWGEAGGGWLSGLEPVSTVQVVATALTPQADPSCC